MLFEFLKYQQDYIMSSPKILIVEKGRQMGLTYCSGFKVVRRIMRSSAPEDHYWLSRDEFTAKQFVSNCLDWIHLFNVVAECEMIDLKEVRTTKITFPNGCNLFILSSSVDAVVGKSGHFYLDEFAIHQSQEDLWSIVYPCVQWGFTITLISTHRSKQTYFYKLCDKARRGKLVGAKLFTFTIMTGIEQGIVDQINKVRATKDLAPMSEEEFLNDAKSNCASEEMFLQEYMAIPADAESSMAINETVLDRNSLPKDSILQARKDGGKYYAGVDIGRHRDLTVIWILEDVSKTKEPELVTRFIKTIRREEFSIQEKKIFEVLNRWKPRMTFVDGTNTGAMIGENIQKRYGIKRAQSIKITAVTRPKFIGDLVNIMSKDFLKIPDDKDVWDDFMSVSRYIGKHGNVDYWIPSRADEGHGDRFMACTLAVQAFVEKGGMSSYFLKQAKVVRDLDAEEEERKEEARTVNRQIRAKRNRRFNY
jgi:phage FluMu gp28-like protein